jgi:NADH-quinone oxidoreductase subunit M
MNPILPLIVLIPFISMLPVLVSDRRHIFRISFGAALAVFLLSILAVYMHINHADVSFSVGYLSTLGLSLSFQLTGLSTILLIMTSIVFLAASMVGEYFIREGERIYNVIFLIAEGASLGVFLSANLFFFYVFWEIAEVMMFFIIFIYGGYDKRYAAFKFIIYSLISSLLLLVSVILLYSSVTPHTFSIYGIIGSADTIPYATQALVSLLLIVSFMIKMPVFPFHTWLPDAHTEAPTTGSMILAGVLLKFGGYGLLLMFLMLPVAMHYGYYLALVFGFSAVYGSFTAMRQTNLKRAIAYTSVADMGIVAVGAAAVGVFGTNGALYAMLSHGIAISVLFLIAGTLDELFGTLEISKLKGIVRNFPALAYLFILGSVAVIGIPLTSGFIGDLLIFIGSFRSFGFLGIVPLGAVLMLGALLLWLVERVFLSRQESGAYRELGRSVVYCGIFLMVATITLGLLPGMLV